MALAFISRNLSTTSDFRHLLEKEGWTVEGQSLVVLEPLPIASIPSADWWFFSSKNAVVFLLAQHPVPPNVRLAALGPGTAKAIEEHLKRRPDFVGNGEPESTAEQFALIAKKGKSLFPGAVHSLQSVLLLVKDRLEAQHLSVYQNSALPSPPDQRTADALVFTSPLNAKAYCSRYPINTHQKLVAIGHSTAQMLQTLGYKEVRIAVEPTEIALAHAVLAP